MQMTVLFHLKQLKAKRHEQLEEYIEDIILWMARNFKLNHTKTQFIMFDSPKDLQKVTERTVHVSTATMLPSESVRNIRAMMDTGL